MSDALKEILLDDSIVSMKREVGGCRVLIEAS